DGDDWLTGGAGADTLRGGAGNDVLFSGTSTYAQRVSNSEWLPLVKQPVTDAGLEAESLDGGEGNDVLLAGYGDSVNGGGGGRDELFVSFRAAPHGVHAD